MWFCEYLWKRHKEQVPIYFYIFCVEKCEEIFSNNESGTHLKWQKKNVFFVQFY